MNFRKLICITVCVSSLLIFVPFDLYSQTFNLLSHSIVNNDLSAQTESRTDLNGVKCGLVKVRCVLDGISFKGNVIGDVHRQDGEYWVYMSNGSKNLGIYHSKLLPLDIDLESVFKDCIKSSTTYLLTLSIPEFLYNQTIGGVTSATEYAPNSQQNNVTTEENHTIKGILRGNEDDFKDGIIGGTLSVFSPNDTKNYKEITVSNIDGEWTISNVNKGDIVKFAYIGFKSKEIKLIGEVPSFMDVTIKWGKGKETEEYFYDPNDKSQYFDLSGNALISRPSKKGTYIRVTDGKAEKFTIK